MEENHNHFDWYRYTGFHKRDNGVELYEYKCEKCGKIKWLQSEDEILQSVEKKVEEPIKWEV
jgi:hypothetical protein